MIDRSGCAPRIGIPKRLFDVHPVCSPGSPEASAYDVNAGGQRFLVDHLPAPQPLNLVLHHSHAWGHGR
jgi:hypothetical protein